VDQIKEAFTKVKQDISFLQEELYFVKKDLDKLKILVQDLISLSEETLKERKGEANLSQRRYQENPTYLEKNPTVKDYLPTEKEIFKPLKLQNKGISTGNGGVPTDRQTDRQTDQQIDFSLWDLKKPTNRLLEGEGKTQEEIIDFSKKDSFKEAASMLESLDNIKKELRLKFKRLTDQEILVFSTLYQLEEEKGHADYKSISSKLNLTESSIRDYVGKLIKKGIPVDKIKINNKSVHLGISPSLKKIASLSTILLLRDI